MRLMTVTILAIAVLAGAESATAAEKIDDTVAIEAAVRDYIEGWFTSDAERMKRALHPNLFKVTKRTTQDGEIEYLDVMEAENLVVLTERNQHWVADKKGLLELEIIHQDDTIAVVHAVSTGFYDVCGLMKLNGEWRVLQVLWSGNDRTE